MKTRLSVVIIITIVTSLAAQDATQPAGSQKRLLTEKDLFYRNGNKMMSVEISTLTGFTTGSLASCSRGRTCRRLQPLRIMMSHAMASAS